MLKSKNALCALFIGTFLGHHMYADNQAYAFYQRLKDIATYQKELAAATVAFTYLAYTAPTLDSRRQLAGAAIASYLAAKLFTPYRNIFEGIVTIAADESGYKQVHYSYPNKFLKQLKTQEMKNLLRKSAQESDDPKLKEDMDIFINLIDELTNACTITKDNPHITEKELKKKISSGFNILDDLVKKPWTIKDNDLFKNFPIRRAQKYLGCKGQS